MIYLNCHIQAGLPRRGYEDVEPTFSSLPHYFLLGAFCNVIYAFSDGLKETQFLRSNIHSRVKERDNTDNITTRARYSSS
jgi:hypothetical protein